MVCRLDTINETEYNKYIIMFKKSTSFYAPVLRHLNANAESKSFKSWVVISIKFLSVKFPPLFPEVTMIWNKGPVFSLS